jgi:hypothetical protein
MSKCGIIHSVALLAALLGLGLPAIAQDEDQPAAGGYGYLLDNVDLLLTNYARFLGRRYDLTEEQDTYTQDLLREKAHDFVDRHKPELRELVNRLFEVRTGGEMNQEELIAWGKRVLPLYNEAKMTVVEANAEWREILNEDQRRIHDEDLKRMHESFQMTEDQLERIVTGQMTVEEFRTPPRPKSHRSARRAERPEPADDSRPTVERGSSSPKPSPKPEQVQPPLVETPQGKPRVREPVVRQPEAGPVEPRSSAGRSGPTREHVMRRQPSRSSKGDTTKATSEKDFESKWEAYVREFIKKYRLNDEQTQRALAILKDCQEKGQRYIKSRSAELEKLDRLVAEMKDSKDKRNVDRIAKINTQRAKLLEPLNEIFERQLKPRLEKLPTSAQRRAAAAEAKKPGQSDKSTKPNSKDKHKDGD